MYGKSVVVIARALQSLGKVLRFSIQTLLKAVMCTTLIFSVNTHSWLTALLSSGGRIENTCIYKNIQKLSAQGEKRSAYTNHQKPARQGSRLYAAKIGGSGEPLKNKLFSLTCSGMGNTFFSEQKSSWKKLINSVIYSFVALLYMFYDDCTMFAYLVLPLSLSD